MSLNGVMQAPGGPSEDWTGGFEFGGWIWPHQDEAIGQTVMSLFDSDFDLLLGRKTYEIFAAYWPYVGEGDAIGGPFDRVAKYVLTRGDDELPWQNSHRLTGIDALRELKAGNGPDLVIQGSSTLYPQLFAAGLIDRFTMLTYPIVLGRGKKLFGDGTPPFAMRMVESRVSASGVTIATYEPAGAVPTGTFGEQPQNEREVARQARMKLEGSGTLLSSLARRAGEVAREA